MNDTEYKVVGETVHVNNNNMKTIGELNKK